MNTPRYEFSETVLSDNYRKMQELLSGCEIHYALKANSDIRVLQALKKAGAFFESASKNEYFRLKKLEVPDEKIIFGLPIKTEALIEELYQAGCRYFVFDDIRELEKLNRLAPHAKKVLRLYVTDLAPLNIGYGMPVDEIRKNQKENGILEHIDGISFHISQNTQIDIMEKVLDRVEALLEQINTKAGSPFILNIGGSYSLEPPEGYYETLVKRLKDLQEKYQLKLLAEPGNAVVNSAGQLIAKVIMIKKQEVFYDVYIDGGEPCGMVKDVSEMEVRGTACETEKKILYRFIGLTCQNKVIFTKRLKLKLNEGDVIVLKNYGAYSLIYQNDFHLWDKVQVELV